MHARHENPLGISIESSFVEQIKAHTKGELSRLEDMNSARIINIDGRTLRFESNVSEFTILLNAAPPSAKNTLDVSEQIILGTVGVKSIMQGGNSAYTSIKDENGLDLAYYDKKFRDLYIPFDMMVLGSDAHKLYKSILKLVVDVLDRELARQHTWGEGDTDVLTGRIKQMIQGRDHNTIERKERELKEAQDNERYFRDELRKTIAKVVRLMEELDRARSGDGSLDKKIVHEFEHIMKNPDVKRIEVHTDRFVIHTNRIIGLSSTGRYYDFGEFQITYKIGNTGITYKGSVKRRGYWSGEDPHPHVSGNSGEPCLGNVGEAIAQLSSMYEYASLVAVAIEFLKAANVSDPAGKNVVRWDEVDMQGNVVSRGVEPDDDHDDDDDGDYYDGDDD